MTALAYQIHILKNGKWKILKSFPPEDRPIAWNLYSSLPKTMGFDGKKFIEEAVKDNGLIYAKPISLKVFEPTPESGGRRSGGDKTDTVGHGPRRSLDLEKLPRQRDRHGSDGAPPGNSVVESLFGFFVEYGDKLRGLKYNLFRSKKTTQISDIGDATKTNQYNKISAGKSDAYRKRYTDEDQFSSNEFVHVESVEFLGSKFFEFVERNLVDAEIRQDGRFNIGICCFTIGALIRIEAGLDLSSSRGKALLNDTLKIFLSRDEAIKSFISQLSKFLTQKASVRFIKAGARCFEHYETGDLQGLAQRFREIFEGCNVVSLEEDKTDKAAVFLVQIADARRLRDEYGNRGMQVAIDYLWASISELNQKHGASVLKVVGEGVLCTTGSPDNMVAIMVGMLRRYAVGLPKEMPLHVISIGGSFGGSVVREGDYFGQTVQIAAALAGHAGPSEACVIADIEQTVTKAGAKLSQRSSMNMPGMKESLSVLHIK